MKFTGKYYGKCPDYHYGMDPVKKLGYILDTNGNVLKEFKGFYPKCWYNSKTLFVKGIGVLANYTDAVFTGVEELEYLLIGTDFKPLHDEPFNFVGASWMGEYLLVKSNGKLSFIDASMQSVYPCIIDEIDEPDEPFVFQSFRDIMVNGKWGTISYTLKELIPCEYEKIDSRDYEVTGGTCREQLVSVRNFDNRYGIYYIQQDFKSPSTTRIAFTGCRYDTVKCVSLWNDIRATSSSMELCLLTDDDGIREYEGDLDGRLLHTFVAHESEGL